MSVADFQDIFVSAVEPLENYLPGSSEELLDAIPARFVLRFLEFYSEFLRLFRFFPFRYFPSFFPEPGEGGGLLMFLEFSC